MKITSATSKAMFIAMLFLLSSCEKKSIVQMAPEDPEDRAAEILSTFSDTTTDSQPLKSLELFFVKAGEAFGSGNGKELEKVIDIQQTFEMLKSKELVNTKLTLINDKLPPIYQTLANFHFDVGFYWDSIEIKKVKSLSKDIKLVYTRHRDPDDATSKMRWWVQRQSGSWKIFDYDELATNVRFSTGFAESFNQHRRLKKTNPDVEKFTKAVVSINSTGEFDLQTLAEINPASLPKSVRPTYHFFLSSALLEDLQTQEARTEAERAKSIDPDFPMLYLLLAEIDLYDEKYESALNHANRYAGFLGEDADFYYATGRAYELMDRPEDAKTAFKKGLSDDPKNGLVWLALLQLSNENDLSDLSERYSNLNDMDLWANDFAYMLADENDKQSLLLLQQIHQSAAPNDENGLDSIEQAINLLPADVERKQDSKND